MITNEEKAKILIVEDEVLIAIDLEMRLKGLGYVVCGKTASAEQALEMVEKEKPDLVLMDIVLSGEMNGIDAAEVMRDKWGIPVVFLTAYADTQKLEHAKLAYPFGYLLKPFQNRDLKITTGMALYVAKVDKERSRAEKALFEEMIWRRILVQGSRDGIVVLDQGGKVYEANQQFADMLGYPVEDVFNLHVWDWDDQWTKEHLLEMLKTVDETGDHFETLHRRKDGSRVDVEISTNAAERDGRKLVFCVCRDITGRKRNEEALRESEKKYRDLFENMSSGFALHQIITDNEGRPIDYVFLEVNPSFEKITGLRKTELIGKKVTVILPGIGNDPADWIGTYGKVALEGAPIQFEQYSKQLKRWYSVTAYCPNMGTFATIFEDISERKKI